MLNIQFLIKQGFCPSIRKFKRIQKNSIQEEKQNLEFSLQDRENKFFKWFRETYYLDDLLIFQVLNHKSFLYIMRDNLQLLPFLFDEKIIYKYRQHIEHNSFHMKENQLQHIAQEKFKLKADPSIIHRDIFNQLKYIAPMFDSYLSYLQDNYSELLKISFNLAQLCDLRRMQNLFPETRKMKRNIYYYHGATNSGKTYAALQKLKQSKNGIYCAPLRMLAHEIQQHFHQINVPCNLITGSQFFFHQNQKGQERITYINANITSYTTELASRQIVGDDAETYDIACIDEVQLISNYERGGSWTRILVGIKAHEIYLIGESRSLKLIEKIVELCGDVLIEQKFDRFSPLQFDRTLFQFKNIKPGDCIISFTIKDLIHIRRMIYQTNPKALCSLIYGRLPPEVRKEQAHKFNSNQTQYLIATNAIGLGLNLNISRIIFYSLQKYPQRITKSDIQQIAGRAGRFKQKGTVLCYKPTDIPYVQNAINEIQSLEDIQNKNKKSKKIDGYIQSKLEKFQNSIKIAYFFPSQKNIVEFRKYLQMVYPEKQFTLKEIMKYYNQYCSLGELFRIQSFHEFISLADMLQYISI